MGLVNLINLKIIFIAGFGSAMLEMIYWYELRKRLEDARFEKLFHSWTYWGIVISMILASGIATWLWYGMEEAGRMSREPREYLLVGAAAPLIFKKVVTSFGSKGEIKLGTRRIPLWKDYFQLS